MDPPFGQGAPTRRDTAYYHYMANVSSLALEKDGRAWATCQDSENTYDGYDTPNFFMGPSLYDGDEGVTLVKAAGGACSGDRSLDPEDVCFLTHTDMLHETPLCTGITHDPETASPHGHVYWAVGARFPPDDPRYDGETQTLVRYDFEKPHGPGSLDHALANIRRHHDVMLKRVEGVPSHLVLDDESALGGARVLYVADTGNGRVLAVDPDGSRFERQARKDVGGEFSLFTAAEISYEYTVFGCTPLTEFAAGLDKPSGLAVSRHHVFVGEHDTGLIKVFDKGTGELRQTFDTGHPGLQGLELSEAGELWYVHGGGFTEGRVSRAAVKAACPEAALPAGPAAPPAYPPRQCGPPETTELGLSIEHVNHDCGYGNVTDMCLGEQYGSSREVCVGQGPDSFNLDMLLMTGFRCHECLPDPCMNGGQCRNLWSKGYECECPEGLSGPNCNAGMSPRPSPSPSRSWSTSPGMGQARARARNLGAPPLRRGPTVATGTPPPRARAPPASPRQRAPSSSPPSSPGSRPRTSHCWK